MPTPIFSTNQPTRTRDRFARGIVNVHPDSKYSDMRYCFFELDSPVSLDIVSRIMESYGDLDVPLYMHTTGTSDYMGWHFVSDKLVHKDIYSKWFKSIHNYNLECPMMTLRITPNKWVGEKWSWVGTNNSETVKRIINLDTPYLQKLFKIVTYPFPDTKVLSQ